MLESSHSNSVKPGHWKTRLEHCPECGRDMVQPTSYEPLWGDRWLVVRDCPNCGWEHEGVFPHVTLRNFEDHLDEVDDLLWDQLVLMEQERMEEEISAFSGALAADAILPEDF